MNLLDSILQAGGGKVVGQLAQNFGISPDAATAIIGQLVPNLAQGMQNNTQQSGGLEALTRALAGGNHQRYIDQPEILNQQSSIDDGNGILGHILGSKDVSRKVAGHTATQTGVDSSIIKKMLPMVASLVMGAMSKSQAAPQSSQMQNQGGGGLGGLLAGVLDADNDGSIADDLIGLAGRFLSR